MPQQFQLSIVLMVRSGYVPYIDGLRAIAVGAVVLYHLDHGYLPGGFTGVDVFFVISGYVIFKSLSGYEEGQIKPFLLSFYRRRFLRILPALILCLLVTGLLSAMFVPDGWLSRLNNRTAMFAFFGISNLFLAGSADGYFTGSIPFNPFIHTWSLGVEEQFYLLFPIFAFYILRRDQRGESTRSIGLKILQACTFASLLYCVFSTESDPVGAFYLLPSRFWELGAGALLFYHQGRLLRYVRIAPSLVFGLGSAAIVLGFSLSSSAIGFPFPHALFPVLGTAMVILALNTETTGTVALFAKPLLFSPVIYVGLISYSLYLWHWPVFSLFRWTVGLSTPFYETLAFAIALAVASASYHFLEKPLRNSVSLKTRSDAQILWISALVVLLACSLVFTALKWRDGLGINMSVTSTECGWDAYSPESCLPRRPKDVNDYQNRQLFVLGDSHAGAYRPMLSAVEDLTGVDVHVFSEAGCGVGGVLRADKECAQNIVQRVLPLIREGDVVFLASLRMPRLSSQIDSFEQPDVEAGLVPSLDAGFQSAVLVANQINDVGGHVIFEMPKPVFRAPLFRCSDWFNRSNPVCAGGFEISKDYLLVLKEPVESKLVELREAHEIYLWDPFPVLCPDEVCKAQSEQGPLFVDGDHISRLSNELLLPSFLEKLSEIWVGSGAKTSTMAR